MKEQRSSSRMIPFVNLLLVVVALQALVVVNAFTTWSPRTLLSASRWSTTITSSSCSSSLSRRSTATAVNNGKEAPSTSSKSKSTTDNNNNTNNNIRLNVFEKARTVTSVCTSGTLCTMSSHDGIEGAPFGSFVDYVLDDYGNPVLLMNEMSMHTINIQKATAASKEEEPPLVTLFTQLSGGSGSASLGSGPNSNAAAGGLPGSKSSQDVARCSLTGTLEKIDTKTAEDIDTIRMRYSLTHAYADQVMESSKFAFYRLIPRKIYYVGGYGVMAKWVEPNDYKTATPDILAKEASDIVGRINRDHVNDLLITAQQIILAGDGNDASNSNIEKIVVTNVDRLGMDCRITCQLGTRRNKLVTDEFRIGFRIPVISVEDAKSEILKVFQEAWEKANGYKWDGDNAQPGTTVPILKIAADSLE